MSFPPNPRAAAANPIARRQAPPRSAAAIAAQRQDLRQALHRCRQSTLALFAGMDADTFCCYAQADFSPAGWHLGHIGWIEAQWILRRLARQTVTFPVDTRLFEADGLPKCDRVHLPSLPQTLELLDQVRSQVLAYLEIAPLDRQSRLWWWLIQHESQHAETISLVLSLQDCQSPWADPQVAPSGASPGHPVTAPDQVAVPTCTVAVGEAADRAAIDNERPLQTVTVPAFQIDRYPVTWGQYQDFIRAGGYQTPHFWTAAGWDWVQQTGATQPQYAPDQRWGDRANSYPVCGVSWYEANAYARFRGQRLPTEWEWEVAARYDPSTQTMRRYPWGDDWLRGDRPEGHYGNFGHQVGQLTPVNAYPAGVSPLGCWDLLGNVWEWTGTVFQGYAGFRPFPYRGYSQVYFADPHYVLRGGSWVTRPWGLRASFRNWYHPHIRQIFAGFRCARNAESPDRLSRP